jgi:hypothetical protein
MKSTLLFLKLCLVGFLFVVSNIVYGQSVSATYNAEDIPTNLNSFDSNCGSPTPGLILTVPLPAGGPWEVTGIDVEYDMTAVTNSNAYMSEQFSRIQFQNNGISENTYTQGIGGSEGTYDYSRTDLQIANGIYPGATDLNFQMQAYRTWGTSTPNCETLHNKVDNGTWKVTVNYEITYCIPPYTNGCINGSTIESFFSSNGTTNISNNGNGCAISDGYSDYSATHSVSASPSSSISVQADITKYAGGVKIWVDWNQNSIFEATELMAESANTIPVAGSYISSFNVPPNATLGNTIMRVRVVEGTTNFNTCDNYSYGETEDYTFNVTNATPMLYTSSTVTQNNTSDVLTCSENQEIIGIEIVTSGTTSPLAATMFRIKTNGSTNSGILNNVSNIDIYYTGTNSTFATINHFGNEPPQLSGDAVDITGSQTLAEGTNYFWVVYDINTSANIGDLIDARCNKISFGGAISIQDPTQSNPSGNRTIVACSKPGGLGTKNLTAWWEPDGLTNGNLMSWPTTHPAGNEAIAVTDNATPHSLVTETPTDGIFNYRKVIDFNGNSGSNQKILKTTAGIDLLKNQNAGNEGTFFVVYAQPSSGASDGVVTYKNGSDGIQMRSWGRIAIGTNDNPNGARDFTPSINRKQMLVSYKGNKSSPTSMIAMKDGSIQSTAFNSSALMATGLTFGAKQMSANVYGEYFSGYLSETIFYNVDLTDAEINRVNSYLAIKYGITLGTPTSPISYNSSVGTPIWSGDANYQRNIIGIGRDENSNLLQKQSHQFDDSVRIYRGSLVTSNNSNTGTFANDRSFVVMGASNGRLCATDNSNTELPPGLGLFSKLEREWRITRTNMNETFNIDIRLAGCGIPGSVDISDLRFLVDTDDNFANGNTVAYADGSSSGFAISYASGTISIKGISTTHIPNNATRFYTIASIKSATPLPVELTEFTSNCESRFVNIKWTTASETNNDFFTLEKSTDGYDFETFALIDGQGNKSTASNYEYHAFDRQIGISYFRLSQTDFDGTVEILKTISSNCSGEFEISIYPNPTKEGVFVSLNSSAEKEFEIFIYNLLGKEISSHKINGSTYVPLPYASGVYLFKYKINGIEKIERIVKQ